MKNMSPLPTKEMERIRNEGNNAPMHTHGPWTACRSDGVGIYNIEAKGTANDCCSIARCKGPDREANARLIAAAPELLEALKAFLRAPSVGSDGPGSTTLRCMDFNLDDARQAIRKATGTN